MYVRPVAWRVVLVYMICRTAAACVERRGRRAGMEEEGDERRPAGGCRTEGDDVRVVPETVVEVLLDGVEDSTCLGSARAEGEVGQSCERRATSRPRQDGRTFEADCRPARAYRP